MWPLLPGDACQLADTQRIRQRRVVGAVGRIDAREAHRSRSEPVHPNPRPKSFLIRDINHALRRYRNLMSPLSEAVRQVEDVTLLTADIRWKELSQQKDTHQPAPDGPWDWPGRQVPAVTVALRVSLLTVPTCTTSLPLEATISLFDPPSKASPTSLDLSPTMTFPVTDRYPVP